MTSMPLASPSFHNFCMKVVFGGKRCLVLPVCLLQCPGGMLAQAANPPGMQGCPPRPGQQEAPDTGTGTAENCVSQSSRR